MTHDRSLSDRYVRGWRNLHAVDADAGKQVMESLEDIAPDLGAPRIGSTSQPQTATAKTRGFRTILAIHRGEVYVPSSELPDGDWLVRVTATDRPTPARILRTAA